MCICCVPITIPGTVHMSSTCIHRHGAHEVSKDCEAVALGSPLWNGSQVWDSPQLPWANQSLPVCFQCWKPHYLMRQPRPSFSQLSESPPLFISATIWSPRSPSGGPREKFLSHPNHKLSERHLGLHLTPMRNAPAKIWITLWITLDRSVFTNIIPLTIRNS